MIPPKTSATGIPGWSYNDLACGSNGSLWFVVGDSHKANLFCMFYCIAEAA